MQVPVSWHGKPSELCLVDPMADPYIGRYGSLWLVCMVETKTEAPAPIEENIYIMTAEERKEVSLTFHQLFITP